MEVQISIAVDLVSGEYEVKFNNLSHPGEPVEWNSIRDAVTTVLHHFEKTHLNQPNKDVSYGDQ